MSRTLRPQMPGLAFHITARCELREEWFTAPLRGEIERIIVRGIASSDAILLAHTVMPNHFHVVLRQGSHTLGWIMQPIMRRIALLVQRRFGLEGHVFERRFRSEPCESATYLRRAIIYTNLNAWRAGLCVDPLEWQWSSHNELTTCVQSVDLEVRLMQALLLFANESTRDPAELAAAYSACVKWRMEKDRCDATGAVYDVREPSTDFGDRHFTSAFCALPPVARKPHIDLRDRALELINEMNAMCDVDALRRRRLNRRLSRVRRELICALLQDGYRVKQIADFLRLSDSAISVVGSHTRYAHVP